MLLLTASSHRLRVITGSAGAIDATASWVTLDGTTVTPGVNAAAITTATSTDLVSGPSSGARNVKRVTIRNRGTAENTVTLRWFDGTTAFDLYERTMQPGETLHWTDDAAPTLFDASGAPVTRSLFAAAPWDVMMAPHFATANLTSTRTLTSGTTFAVYVGRVPRSVASVQARFRVTTAAATITWAEAAIAKGAVSLAANPSLTVVGFADISTPIASTGQKSVTINVSSGQVVNEGDQLWLLLGNNATTAGIVRAQSIADDLQVGCQASLATRPSLNVGVAQTYTLESATALAPWVAVIP